MKNNLKRNSGITKISIALLMMVIIIIGVIAYYIIKPKTATNSMPQETDEQNTVQETTETTLQPKPINELIYNFTSEDVSKAVSIGKKADGIFLIFPDLNSKQIYKMEYLYSSQYLVKDNIIYVIFEELGGNTAYVDIINLNTGIGERVTKEEINNGNTNRDITVYYEKRINTNYYVMYKNLKENLENKYIDLSNGETLLSNYNSNLLSNQKNKFNITDDKKMVLFNDKEIYINEDEGLVEDISLIERNILQITVEHLGAKNGGIVWYPDVYLYYYINEDKLTESKEGFIDIRLLNDNDI